MRKTVISNEKHLTNFIIENNKLRTLYDSFPVKRVTEKLVKCIHRINLSKNT